MNLNNFFTSFHYLKFKNGSSITNFGNLENVVNFNIKYITLPNVGYTIEESYNILYLNNNLISFPPQNYSKDDFLVSLRILLHEYGVSVVVTDIGKIMFKSNSAFSVKLIKNNVSRILGFYSPGTFTSTYDSGIQSHIIESPSYFILQDNKYLIVKCNKLFDPILMTVPINNSGLIVHQNMYPPLQKAFEPVNINDFIFNIENEFSEIYDTKGVDIHIVLEVLHQFENMN